MRVLLPVRLSVLHVRGNGQSEFAKSSCKGDLSVGDPYTRYCRYSLIAKDAIFSVDQRAVGHFFDVLTAAPARRMTDWSTKRMGPPAKEGDVGVGKE
jgi:hypothetical protein